jgi:hypothetical protein
MGDRLQTGEPYKGLAGAAVSPVLYRIVRNWSWRPLAAWRVALWDPSPRWVLAQTRQEACDRLETTVMRPSGTREKQTKQKSVSAELSDFGLWRQLKAESEIKSPWTLKNNIKWY